ncbi:MAG: riboflavin synthase [Helicobacteraceae bacterium]|nr:riboflavin synthase [Helicobacteraceae bacterium]
MFTGLIREIAHVKLFNGEKLRLSAAHRPQIGDSIAVNGACLTVISLEHDGFSLELSHTTQGAIAVENLRSRVHIEAAMQMGERFEGHIVQGHIDAIGEILRVEKRLKSLDLLIAVGSKVMRLIAPKGSIAIDGVSLTVTQSFADRFLLTLIPHTLQNTLFLEYRAGRKVNVETDLFARYTAHLLAAAQNGRQSIEKIEALF